MENENDLNYGIYGQTPTITRVVERLGEIDFISFHVQSFVFPPEKTNKKKFLELFGKD
jgi:hypothetical protein